MQRWARSTFFESAIAIPQLEGSTTAIAIPQLFKETMLRNCNSAIAIFPEVRNLRASLRQFLAYFCRVVAWNLYIYFFTARCFFCYSMDFREKVACDFRPLFFFVNQPPNG
jgi:hypothetical protein